MRPTPRPLPPVFLLMAGLWLPCAPMHAQEGPVTGTVVIQPENVRMDFAQVMRVQPVYQTLRATRMEPRCPNANAEAKGLSRIVGAVKGALAREPDPSESDCEMVPVAREFRRPIAYDVDYVYRGMKYRSRLPYDPGNRLRVRVSVMPHVPGRAP